MQQQPKHPQRQYSIGTSITLYDRSATEHEIAIEISSHFRIGYRRKSQVVLAKLERGTLGTNEQTLNEQANVVAKFYDSRYSPHDIYVDGHETCMWSKDNEIHAYEKLQKLQGELIPLFYGEYTYTSNELVIPVLIFSYINYPTLVEYFPFNFTAVELNHIIISAKDAVQKLHERGVYHRDIELHNIMYNRETTELMVIDFGESVCADYPGEIPESRFKDVLVESKGDDDAMLSDAIRTLAGSG